MAKKNGIPGPSTAEAIGVVSPVAEVQDEQQSIDQPAVETLAAETMPAVVEVLVACYIDPSPSHGYVSRRFEAHLTDQQARSLRALRNGLHERHEKLANGHHVDTTADAVRWMLEQLSEPSEATGTPK